VLLSGAQFDALALGRSRFGRWERTFVSHSDYLSARFWFIEFIVNELSLRFRKIFGTSPEERGNLKTFPKIGTGTKFDVAYLAI
jgi:hypothetical protein